MVGWLKVAVPTFVAFVAVWVVIELVVDALIFDSPVTIAWSLALVTGLAVAVALASLFHVRRRSQRSPEK